MPKCPHCGNDLPRENSRIGSEILDEFLVGIGGPKQLAKDLAGHFKKNRKSKQAQSLYRMLLDFIQNEDEARLNQNHVEEVSESREQAYVMEYVLSNRPLLLEINAIAQMRGMLPDPNVIEGELAAISGPA